MNIKDIKLWKKPEGSYSFAAYPTYDSALFHLRTGIKVSVLSVRNTTIYIELEGEVRVKRDHECWKIINHLNLHTKVVNQLMKAAELNGYHRAKKELRDWLRDWLRN